MGYFIQADVAVPARTPDTHTRFRGLSGGGLRYYIPAIGRWACRDPLPEDGARILYGRARLAYDQESDDARSREVLADTEGDTDNDAQPSPVVTVHLFALNDPVNRWDLLGLVCCCSSIASEKNAIIAAAQVWNKTSPKWSWEYQCTEQANALITYLLTKEYKCWVFTVLGGAKKKWPLGVTTGKHHIVQASPNPSSDECSIAAFTMDAFKGTKLLFQDPNDAGNVVLGTPADFQKTYPIPIP